MKSAASVVSGAWQTLTYTNEQLRRRVAFPIAIHFYAATRGAPHKPMRIRTIIIGTLLGIVLADLTLQCLESVEAYRNYDDSVFSLHALDGTLLSRREGRIKLQLYPPSVYRNYPSYSRDTFHINSRAMRGPEFSPTPIGKTRMVLMGGSTAFGAGSPSDNDTIAHQLEVLIPDSEVINAGVSGFTSQQELGFLVSDVLKLRPAVVISLSGWNDFYQESWLRFRYGSGFKQLEDQLRLTSGITGLNPLLRVPLAAEQMLFPSISFRLRDALRAPRSFPLFEQCTPDCAESYISSMRTMHQIATRVLGAEFVVAIQASFNAMRVARGILPADRDVEFISSSRGYNCLRTQAVAAFAASAIPVLDLDGAYADLREEMFIDHVHFSSQGNAVIARHIADFLRATRMAAPSLSPSPNEREQGHRLS